MLVALPACARDDRGRGIDRGARASFDSPAPAAPAEPSPPPPVEREWPRAELRPGGAVLAEIGPGEVHRWRLPLAGGELVRLVVEQRGVDVELSWLDPAAATVLTADRASGARGPELVMALAETPGEHVLQIAAFQEPSEGRYEARIEVLGPAGPEERLAARTYRRFLQAESLPRAEAAAVREECSAVLSRLGEDELAGEVLFRMSGDHFLHREYGEAAQRARRAAEMFVRAGAGLWEGLARNRAAASLWSLSEAGATEQALEEYRRAATIGRRLEDPPLEAAALLGLGQAYRRLGEVQEALAHYEAALRVLPAKGTIDHAQTLHNLGVLHSLYFHDFRRGAELLTAARDTWPEWDPAYERRKATSLNQLGRVALEQGDLAGARREFEAALALHEGGDACGRAVVLARLALIEEAGGRPRQADTRRDQALEIVVREGCPRSRPTIDLLAAEVAEGRGELAGALAGFEAAAARAEALADRTTLAEALTGVARVRRALGEPEAAIAASGRALAIAEGVRPTVLREDLRTAFFSTVQDGFDLHVGLLSEAGRHADAWAAAEAARARALQDLLAEAGAELRRGADPGLLARQKSLERRLSFAVNRRQAEREPDSEALRGLRHEIDGLVADLERVRAEIRRLNPGYAALIQPRPLTVAEVQSDLLDDDTLLLEFRLGEETSWLWAIGRDSFSAHPLPPRAEIEPLAAEAARWLRSLEWPGKNPLAACELSRRLLAPVAARLGVRRLVLVLDGALESVPFAALPHPAAGSCPQAPPLVARHEVVHLPSTATLAAQRRQLAGRPAAAGGVAVVADPVYGRDDPRLRRPRPTALAASPADGDWAFRRLPHAGREAAAIRALAPGRVRVVTGFEASKEVVTGGSFSRQQVLHFALHGVLDPEQPLLSHLVLSRLDGAGEPVDARLHAHEIYDLDLPAELVVLSACDTALGRQVAGEGMVAGLPRAFLYAGAARVMVSLWQVPDRSTADLMEAFYRRFLLHGEPPGRALQGAQQELWRAGRPPRQWAGWMLQGDWRPLPPFAAPR